MTINTEQIKQCTCFIMTDSMSGTGVFVREDLIVTCLHVVENDLSEEFTVRDFENNVIRVSVKDYCPLTDLAILQTKDYRSKNVATLCSREVHVAEQWGTHGHPSTGNGEDTGYKLTGVVCDLVTKLAADVIHDLVLKPTDFDAQIKYAGFSGSGVISKKGLVICILRYKDAFGMGGVSIKKAEFFFTKNNIHFEQDELEDFTPFIDTAFEAHEEGIRDLCKAQAKAVANAVSPQAILKSLKGNVYFPKQEKTLPQLITDLHIRADVNTSLWAGWLELLSYVQMLRGAYTDVNAITITLPAADVAKMMDLGGSSPKIDISLKLEFYFTEEKEFFKIARKYIIEKDTLKSLKYNTCHIFHSPSGRFGTSPVTADMKRQWVENIANPRDAVMTIPGKIDFGFMSLIQLTAKVSGCISVAQATANLENLFKDAIK